MSQAAAAYSEDGGPVPRLRLVNMQRKVGQELMLIHREHSVNDGRRMLAY